MPRKKPWRSFSRVEAEDMVQCVLARFIDEFELDGLLESWGGRDEVALSKIAGEYLRCWDKDRRLSVRRFQTRPYGESRDTMIELGCALGESVLFKRGLAIRGGGVEDASGEKEEA